MIVYKILESGQADRFRYEDDSYTLESNETSIAGGTIPEDISTFDSDAYKATQALVQYKKDRQTEYPTINELVVALYDTDDKEALVAKRNAVKAKYPKP